ncbi:MAG TPA: glycerol-3-phosphate responsive antiterminator [Chloroflexia bacterium]|nr:glycerol-3-phosphate responsive antiterminator [Chloroflexia bacterium]
MSEPVAPALPSAIFERRVIPALRNISDLPVALDLGLPAVIMLKGDIFELEKLVNAAQNRLGVLVHIDLLEGIGRDKAGLAYLQRQFAVTGVVSTRTSLVKEAHSLGLLSILRLFVLDSTAYSTGIHLVNSINPDAVEMLPGVVVPYIKDQLTSDIKKPVIASGLIRTTETLREVLAAGASAVSTSKVDLWHYRP